MICDIFIKTYSKDAELHPYCMASYRKFCTGFSRVVVVESDEPNGYKVQMCVKMKADLYCPEADYVLITDSDTLFIEPVTPQSFMRDGKPIWFYTPVEAVSPDARTWLPTMEKFNGEKPPAEFMRRQPFMFPKWVLPKFREFCRERHGRTLDQYILETPQFSEYNCIGFWLWLHHRDAFSWINTEEELPSAKVHQAWSHAPLEENVAKFKEILA